MDKGSDRRVYADLGELVALQFQARGFSFLPRQPVHSILAGRHASRLRGRGLDFEELRHYRPGDDIRTMDWKVTNRTSKPHVRVYTEERERPVLLLVDQRIGMFFGSRNKMKSVVAAELAALTGWRTVGVGDRIGALVFNDAEIVEIHPHRSKKTVLRILHQVMAMNHALHAGAEKQLPVQLNQVLRKTERLASHDYLIVVISDFEGWDEESVKRIKRLGRHNDLIAGLVFDPLERDLPETGRLVVSDGALQIEVDARSSDLKTGFRERFLSSVAYLQGELVKHGVPVIPIETVAPIQDQIRAAIGARAR